MAAAAGSSSLKAGVRFADREQKVRYSTYNWAPIAPAWSCNGPGFNVDNTTARRRIRRPAAIRTRSTVIRPASGNPPSLDGHYNGSVFPNGPLVFLNRATLSDYDLHTEGLADRNVNAPQGWNPLCDRTANVEGEGCFTAPEILDVHEKNKAAYLMLRFGGPEAKLGNVNVRGQRRRALRQDRHREPWQRRLPDAQWYNDALASGQGACNAADNGTNQATDIQCWLTPALLAFSTGTGDGQHAR